MISDLLSLLCAVAAFVISGSYRRDGALNRANFFLALSIANFIAWAAVVLKAAFAAAVP